MRLLPPCAVLALLVALAAGCGDDGAISEEELAQAKRESYALGQADGRAAGLAEARRRAREQLAAAKREAREAGFADGIEYVFHDLDPVPGQDYAIAFAAGDRGFFVRDSLPMKPGLAYECPPQSPYCTVSGSTSDVPQATSEPAPADPCDPHYPNVCLDPDATDYDCAGSGENGPEFVEGPVRILNGDPYNLDGYPPDDIGCDER